jgi:hypothetical protein
MKSSMKTLLHGVPVVLLLAGCGTLLGGSDVPSPDGLPDATNDQSTGKDGSSKLDGGSPHDASRDAKTSHDAKTGDATTGDATQHQDAPAPAESGSDSMAVDTGVDATKPPEGLGSPCSTASQCESGFCAPEGLCCNNACTESCEYCSVTGTCTPVAANQPTRPGHTACVTDGTNCGGYCDGTDPTCTYSTVQCVAPSCGCLGINMPCSANAAVNCANGMCPSRVDESCNGFDCNADATACETTCTGSGGCHGLNTCCHRVFIGACASSCGSCPAVVGC